MHQTYVFSFIFIFANAIYKSDIFNAIIHFIFYEKKHENNEEPVDYILPQFGII